MKAKTNTKTNFHIGNQKDKIRYINLKLASMGQPFFEGNLGSESNTESSLTEEGFVRLANSLINNYKERSRLLSNQIINPIDLRIQKFINTYLNDIEFEKSLNLPYDSFVLDTPGLGREISLPPNKNEFKTDIISSYRIYQGILNNPKYDRRTTEGSFHIVNGGLIVPYDKKAVPKIAFAHMLHSALNPPEELMILPYTSAQKNKAKVMASLYLRPVVSPEVKGVIEEKSMEIHFFAPGSLVSNLDFVESIFGNAGDPYILKNDAALDIDHWTGHTGCVILAPQLINLKKKDIGLPQKENASERKLRDGMYWEHPDELYNDGKPFKITCRDKSGVVITLIADNYFGYSKKEVKTQISYSANLFGCSEEEHSGGALVFPRKKYGTELIVEDFMNKFGHKHTFAELKKEYTNKITFLEENYGVDKTFNNIIYVPENAEFRVYDGIIKWRHKNKNQQIKLIPNNTYIIPSGNKVSMERHPFAPIWYLVCTSAEGTFIHKPSTVSGGGKSEIAKSLSNAIVYGQFHVENLEKDIIKVEELIEYDYSNRFIDKKNYPIDKRKLLDDEMAIGSVVKLFTPSELYTKEYNKFIQPISENIKALILYVKSICLTEKTTSWKDILSVDIINGRLGHVLLANNRKVIRSMLRVGFTADKSWYVNTLRPDFFPAAKIQMEDDISSTITLPASSIQNIAPHHKGKSVKFVQNCEHYFFQRPDEAVNRGYDIQAEKDLSEKDTFISNYEPLSPTDAKNLIDDAAQFDKYTDNIKELIKEGAKSTTGLSFITPSHTRVLQDGSRSTNPRYLQLNPLLSDSPDSHIAEMGIRLRNKIKTNEHVVYPIDAVLAGRRNNPSDKTAGIRPLSVFNPIHYQEYPELFMDFISSLTGKSPSTTGAGSEGALTKGPFNMLAATTDLNNALISFILTDYKGFTSAAGYIGSKYKFEHDISILIPELWCRIRKEEKDPNFMIEEGCLEKVEDFEYKGEKILASRLGYRITNRFVFKHFGRIFEEPTRVFNEEILKPELQDMDDFADGVKNIVEAQQKAALMYFADGSIDNAIPPLKAILNIMAYGEYEGKGIYDPEIRQLFSKEYVKNAKWYKDRLVNKQELDIKLWNNHLKYISDMIANPINESLSKELNLKDKIKHIKIKIKYLESKEYLKSLEGTIGGDIIAK